MFFQLLSTVKVNIVAKIIQSAYLCAIFHVKDKKCHFSRNSSNSINQSITYFNTLRQRAKKLVQNTNVYK